MLLVGVSFIKGAQRVTDTHRRNELIMRHKVWMIRFASNAVSVGVFRLCNIVLVLANLSAGVLGRRCIFGWQIFAVWETDIILGEIIYHHILVGNKPQGCSSSMTVLSELWLRQPGAEQPGERLPGRLGCVVQS